MTDDTLSECSCRVDCSGLREIATASDNLKPVYLNKLATGVIGVPTAVWQEYQDLYEEEAAEIEPHIARKITMRTKYYAKAASITDKNKMGFSHGPYDRMGDLYSASICACEGHTLLTASEQVSVYANLNAGCTVSELSAWAVSEDVFG